MEEIIIQTIDNKLSIIVLEKGKIVEYYEYDRNNISKIGNIYVGKIKDVLPNNNTLFVDVGFSKPGFLQLDNFEQKYKYGDNVLVQVKKDEIYNKGAKLSDMISISGKYIVLLLNSNIYTFSSKLDSASQETIELIKQNIPHNCGFIVRTEAQNATKEAVLEELSKISKVISSLEEKTKEGEIGLIYEASKLETRIINDFVKSTTKKIYTNDTSIYDNLAENLKNSGVELYCSKTNYIQEFGLETEFERIYQRKIWLKSSGYIVIDKTEAMTVIDVNSGRFLGKTGDDREEVAYKANIEAAEESAKQIRLKNIGGIIVIDFINMQSEEHKQAVIEAFKSATIKDRSKIEVFEFTKLGLLEITQKSSKKDCNLAKYVLYYISGKADLLYLNIEPYSPEGGAIMNNYETIIIIDPNLGDEDCAKVVDRFTEMINKEGKVESTESWGKRKLAYPIQKNNEGYYVLVNFSSNPEFVDELNRVYNITDEIIKHIVVKKDK